MRMIFSALAEKCKTICIVQRHFVYAHLHPRGGGGGGSTELKVRPWPSFSRGDSIRFDSMRFVVEFMAFIL